jgi:hypothetical protein
LVPQTGSEKRRNSETSKINYEVLVGWSTISLVGRRHSLAVVAASLRRWHSDCADDGKIVDRYRINTKQIFPEQRPLRY